jgi:hypothetical protein
MDVERIVEIPGERVAVSQERAFRERSTCRSCSGTSEPRRRCRGGPGDSTGVCAPEPGPGHTGCETWAVGFGQPPELMDVEPLDRVRLSLGAG